MTTRGGAGPVSGDIGASESERPGVFTPASGQQVSGGSGGQVTSEDGETSGMSPEDKTVLESTLFH